MKLIVIEHQHGAGGSHHTDALAARLNAAGIAAESYHHPASPTRDPYRAALHYATARAEFCHYAPSHLVYVVDRWVESTVAVGWTLDAKTRRAERNALLRLATAERAVLPVASLVVVLDAPDPVLDARILARGAEVTDVDRACREVYRNPSVLGPWGAVRVDTSGDAAAVEARLLAMALARLGRIDDAVGLWHEAHKAPDFHEWVGFTRGAGAGFDANGSEVTT